MSTDQKCCVNVFEPNKNLLPECFGCLQKTGTHNAVVSAPGFIGASLGASRGLLGPLIKSDRVLWRPLLETVRVPMSLLDFHEFPRVPATVSKLRSLQKTGTYNAVVSAPGFLLGLHLGRLGVAWGPG